MPPGRSDVLQRRPGGRTATLALGLVTCALCCAAAELGLRRFHPTDARLFEPHPRYLHRLIPGARRLYVRAPEDGRARIMLEVNRLGFRGPELLPRGAARRVVVYGDSFVEARATAWPETFCARLAGKLTRALAEPVEVVNAGVAGYGPDQVSLRIADELGWLAPDLVIVAIFAGNDFGDLIRNKIYRLASDGSLRPNPYTLSVLDDDQFAEADRISRQSMLLRRFRHLLARVRGERPTAAGAFDFGHALAVRRQEYEEFVVRGDNAVRRIFGDSYDADMSLAPTSEAALYKRDLMEAVMVLIAELTYRGRVPSLFVFIPAPHDVVGPRPDSRTYPAYQRDRLTTWLVESAQRRALNWVDLYPVFERAGAPRLYLPRDQHWNAAGQELAAELVEDAIIGRGLIEAAHR